MKQYLESLHNQAAEALEIGKKFSIPYARARVRAIVFCGLGGSAISGDILRVLAKRKGSLPFYVCREPVLPPWAGKDTLVILSSYSGNTEEVLAALKAARAVKAKLVAMTSGGRLEAEARRLKIPVLKIPGGLPPRCAIGHSTFALLPSLRKGGFLNVPAAEVTEALGFLTKDCRDKARRIAASLANRAIHLYAASGILEPVVTRWKAQLAENSKTLASSCLLPEMFHNEIEGWRFPEALLKTAVAVFFTDRDDPAKLTAQRDESAGVISERGVEVLTLETLGKTPLARIFSLIYLGDWVSYELAMIYAADPVAIPHIERLKQLK